jgi:hypothetical protein
MLSTESDGDLFAAKTEKRNDQMRGVTHTLSSTELDDRIKQLISLIEAGFLSRVRFLDEFAELRALLNAQLARAQTLADELPSTYFQTGEGFSVAHQNPLGDRTAAKGRSIGLQRPNHRSGE